MTNQKVVPSETFSDRETGLTELRNAEIRPQTAEHTRKRKCEFRSSEFLTKMKPEGFFHLSIFMRLIWRIPSRSGFQLRFCHSISMRDPVTRGRPRLTPRNVAAFSSEGFERNFCCSSDHGSPVVTGVVCVSKSDRAIPTPGAQPPARGSYLQCGRTQPNRWNFPRGTPVVAIISSARRDDRPAVLGICGLFSLRSHK